jgi:phage tail sheath protein FI
MITLNTDKKEVAFILADAPFTLDSSSLSLQNWATNANSAGENGKEGLVSSSAYAAVHYPHGLTTNLDGTNVVVPASHIALRTLAYNDQVAYQWFAPAGFNRGLVQNATSVGYVAEATSEFQVVNLSEGQRDTLYANKINPIGNFPGQGLAVFGQKTLNPSSSALDRINVARLINYIRYQLDIGVKPFLFEPNDSITRQGVKRVADNLLSELVSLRGVFDFITVCDETNNTTARINRNELYLDVAIQPTKAVEFIYVPIRIQSTLGQTGS